MFIDMERCWEPLWPYSTTEEGTVWFKSLRLCTLILTPWKLQPRGSWWSQVASKAVENLCHLSFLSWISLPLGLPECHKYKRTFCYCCTYSSIKTLKLGPTASEYSHFTWQRVVACLLLPQEAPFHISLKQISPYKQRKWYRIHHNNLF